MEGVWGTGRFPQGATPPLPDAKAGQAFGLLVEDVHRLDVSSPRAEVGELQNPLYRLFVSFQDRLDRPVGTVGDPPRHVPLLREASDRVPEEHALHATADDEAATDHLA